MSSCPICSRYFGDRNAVYQHAKAKHKKHDVEHLNPRGREDDEPSMADRMIEAQLQFAMGGPVDEDWLLDAVEFEE